MERTRRAGAPRTARIDLSGLIELTASTLSGAVANGRGPSWIAALRLVGTTGTPRPVAPETAVGIESVERQQLPAMLGEQMDRVEDVLRTPSSLMK